MKICFYLLFSTLVCVAANANTYTYVGSTPAHTLVRAFLQISGSDSIDFIRWKLELGAGTYKLQCRYGLSQAGTPGFSNERRVSFEGQLTQSENYYHLVHNGKNVTLWEVNVNVLHFLDASNRMLSGNGGYSYALNNTHPVKTDKVSIRSSQRRIESPVIYEGRTPCKELSTLLGLNKSEACNKLKWYFIFYTDSLTNKPSYFLMGGIGYRRETMAKGKWQIVTQPNGRIVNQLEFDKWARPLNLLKGDDNILFFTGADGQPLVGDEDFSYTLNRRKEAYPSR